MIASLLLLTESLFRERLAAWAGALHAAALVFLVLAWGSPPVLWLWRRHRARRHPPPRLYWSCLCGKDNPPESKSCSQCALLAYVPAWRRTSAGRAVSSIGKWCGRGAQAAGWAAFYLLPAPVLFSLGLHRFGGGALRELFAAAALIAALGAAALLRSSLTEGGPVTRAVNLLAAGSLGGAALLSAVLWAAAPFPPLTPLAQVRLFPDGRVRVETPGGLAFERAGQLEEGSVRFQVRSAFLSWPLLQVRQTVPLAAGPDLLVEPWVDGFLEKGARRWTADVPHRLRIALREDTLFGAPGPYLLHETAEGGLVLESIPEQVP